MSNSIVFISPIFNPDKTEPNVCKATYTYIYLLVEYYIVFNVLIFGAIISIC